MTKLYVAYEDGVYRQSTVGVALSEEELYPSILGYFKSTDDYHNVSVEILEAGKPVEGLYIYSIRSAKVKVLHPRFGSAPRIHGERIVSKDGLDVDSLWQEYKLKEGETFAP